MKRDRHFGLIILLGILLTACMGESGDKATYFRYGIVRTQPSLHLFTTNTDGNDLLITAPELDAFGDLVAGDCFQVEFKADRSNEGTSQLTEAEILRIDPIARWTARSPLTDTAAVDTTERFIGLRDFSRSLLIEKHFFVIAEHSNYKEGQVNTFDISFNPEKEKMPETEPEEGSEETTPTEVDNRIIYNLFLRFHKEEGKDSLTVKTWKETNAFLLGDVIKDATDRYLMQDKDTLFIRFNYPTGFNSDTTRMVWTQTALFSIPLSDNN